MTNINLHGYISQKNLIKGEFYTNLELKKVDDNGIHYFHYYKGFVTLKSAKKHFRQLTKAGLGCSAIYLVKNNTRIIDSWFNASWCNN